MSSSSTPAETVAAPRIALEHRAIRVVDGVAFGRNAAEASLRFLTRVLSIPEVTAVTIDHASTSAVIEGTVPPETLLPALVKALRGETRPIRPADLPPSRGSERFTIRRRGSLLTRCEVFVDVPGILKLRIDGLKGNAALADRLARATASRARLATIPPCTWTGIAVFRYDPAATDPADLIRLADEALPPHDESTDIDLAKPVRFGPANTSMGLAALSETVLPAIGPFCGVFLVALNLDNFREAFRQIKARRLGLPVLYSSIVGATLVAGQFLPSALMTWLFCYWKRRYRMQLAIGRDRLLARHLPAARLARVDGSEDTDILVAPERLATGDRILVRADEMIPADGRLIEGEGVVDERIVSGLSGVSRKRVGDRVLAGSKLLAGEIRLEVERAGEATTASAFRRAVLSATSVPPGRTAPTKHSEEFAAKAVGPTLAAAGLGMLTGDVAAVSAILRPDYATGPGIAVPLETLRDVSECAQRGVLMREADALRRLTEVDLIVIEDQDEFWRGGVEIARIHSRLPEEVVLKLAASAYRHFRDPRGDALVDAARSRGVPLARHAPIDFANGVAILHQGKRIRVHEHDPKAGILGPLVLDVDDVTVGLIEFRGTNRAEASAAFQQFRSLVGVPTVFLSGRPRESAGRLAEMLGFEVTAGGLTNDGIANLLADCKRRRLRAAHIARTPSPDAHVSITLGGDPDLETDRSSFVIRDPNPARLISLWETARRHVDRVQESHRFILYPNLLCVAGAFLLGFTGMTSVLISNIGTYGLFRRSRESLDALASVSDREPTP